MRLRVRLVVLFVVASILLAGCGESSNSSPSSGASTPASGSAAQTGSGGSTGAGASEAYTSGKPAHLPSGMVARVGGTPIKTAAYNHQLQVSAPATIKPLIANASDYSACIAAGKVREEKTEKLIKAQEEKFAKKSKGRAKGFGLFPRGRKAKTDAQRKQQCELQYKAQKQQAVSSLIRRLQTQSQAKELGVEVSESDVAKQVKTRDASQKALAKSSRASEFGLAEAPHYTGADLREMVRSELLETKVNMKIREKFTKPGSISQGQMESTSTNTSRCMRSQKDARSCSR